MVLLLSVVPVLAIIQKIDGTSAEDIALVPGMVFKVNDDSNPVPEK